MVTIRRMEEGDVKQAGRLEADNFSMPWSEEDFLEMLHQEYASYYVAECDGVITGMCGLRNLTGEGEITNVVVDGKYRRLGIAAMLMNKVLEDGNKLGVTAFTLEVRAGNEPAICLYRSLGFQTEGVRRNFYERPIEDALIMWKR